MSVSSVAAIAVQAQAARTQTALAAVFAKQNQQADAALLSAILESVENLQQVTAAAPPGTGLIVDTSA